MATIIIASTSLNQRAWSTILIYTRWSSTISVLCFSIHVSVTTLWYKTIVMSHCIFSAFIFNGYLNVNVMASMTHVPASFSTWSTFDVIYGKWCWFVMWGCFNYVSIVKELILERTENDKDKLIGSDMNEYHYRLIGDNKEDRITRTHITMTVTSLLLRLAAGLVQ